MIYLVQFKIAEINVRKKNTGKRRIMSTSDHSIKSNKNTGFYLIKSR